MTNQTTALAAIQGTPPHANNKWRGYCKFAAHLHRKNQLAKFLEELRAGRCTDVEDPELFEVAAALAVVAADAGVRLTNWGSPPSEEELAGPAWVAERLAAERANQAATDNHKRWGQGLARALGEPCPPGGGGSISPVYKQKSKLPLDELERRLRQAMSRPGFQHEWLDHRSPHYVPVGDGGISNKQVTIMAGLITGRQEPRPFDETWAIVTNWLHEQDVKQQPDEDA